MCRRRKGGRCTKGTAGKLNNKQVFLRIFAIGNEGAALTACEWN